jgi:hypothetical protein
VSPSWNQTFLLQYEDNLKFKSRTFLQLQFNRQDTKSGTALTKPGRIVTIANRDFNFMRRCKLGEEMSTSAHLVRRGCRLQGFWVTMINHQICLKLEKKKNTLEGLLTSSKFQPILFNPHFYGALLLAKIQTNSKVFLIRNAAFSCRILRYKILWNKYS